jgi:serralysin
MIATGDGADTVYGETGNDQIDAGNGNDMIVGGAGADELTGGLGADRFVYVATADSAPSGSDKIYDFNALEGDRIDLTMIDASTATPDDDAFVLAAAFHGIAGELVIANAADSSLLVSGDVDGDGLADIAILVKDVAALNAGDFWL